MENSLWSFGCSQTAEYHPVDVYPKTSYCYYKEWKGGNLPPVWPTILANKLNYKNKNKGAGATSNYEIFYSFCEAVSHFKKNDIVIFQWTAPYRFLLANTDGHYLQTILPNEKYEEFNQEFIDFILVNRSNQVWIRELIYFSKIINEICKEKEVHLFYWSYHEQPIHSYMETSWNEFPNDRYIKSNNNKHLLGYLHQTCNGKSTIVGETEGQVEDHHLGEYGHKAQADLFYDYIKQRI